MRPSCGPIDGNNHFFQQSTQQLFAIAIRGGRRHPDFVEISTERADLFFLFWAECAGSLLLSLLPFRLSRRQIAQTFFPLRLQAARDESILGLVRLRRGPFPPPVAIDSGLRPDPPRVARWHVSWLPPRPVSELSEMHLQQLGRFVCRRR